jgi:hypothetical protein
VERHAVKHERGHRFHARALRIGQSRAVVAKVYDLELEAPLKLYRQLSFLTDVYLVFNRQALAAQRAKERNHGTR